MKSVDLLGMIINLIETYTVPFSILINFIRMIRVKYTVRTCLI